MKLYDFNTNSDSKLYENGSLLDDLIRMFIRTNLILLGDGSVASVNLDSLH
jgi:hypothetical protein